MGIPRDSAWLVAAQLAGTAAALVNSVVISRALGPADRGVYSLVLGAAMLVVSVGGLGLGVAGAHQLLRRGRAAAAVHANALVAAAAAGLAAAAVYALAAPALHRGPLRGVAPAFVWTGLALVPPFLYASTWGSLMGALGRFEQVGRLEIGAAVAGTAVTAGALGLFRLGPGGLLAVTAGTAVLAAAARLLALAALAPPWRAFDGRLLAEGVGFGLRGHPGQLAFYACLRVDVFFVNLLVGPAGVGHYTLAASIAEKAWRLPASLSDAAVARVGGGERAAAGSLAGRVLRHALLLSVGLSLVFGALAPWAVPLVYGEAFAPAVLPLLLLLPGAVCTALAVALASYVTLQLGRPLLVSALGVAAAALYLPAAWWAIGRFGTAGAAAASSAAFALSAGLLFAAALREPGLAPGEIVRFGRDDFAAYARLARAFAGRGDGR